MSPLIESTANQAVVSKALEWSPVSPPTESISNYRAHQVFANFYYDFPNDSRWTPFLGAGAGLARTDLRYTRRLIRKTLDQGYQDVEPPLTLADRPAAAAGTVSLLQPDLSGMLPGFQILGGLDYAVGERTSIGLNAHWARFGELRPERDLVDYPQPRTGAGGRDDAVLGNGDTEQLPVLGGESGTQVPVLNRRGSHPGEWPAWAGSDADCGAPTAGLFQSR